MVARAVYWTAEMDAALASAAHRQEGDRLIAEQIGVDRHVCRRRRKQLGLPPGKKGRPKSNGDRDERMAKLSQTLPIRVVAERHGVSRDAAYHAVRRLRKAAL